MPSRDALELSGFMATPSNGVLWSFPGRRTENPGVGRSILPLSTMSFWWVRRSLRPGRTAALTPYLSFDKTRPARKLLIGRL